MRVRATLFLCLLCLLLLSLPLFHHENHCCSLAQDTVVMTLCVVLCVVISCVYLYFFGNTMALFFTFVLFMCICVCMSNMCICVCVGVQVCLAGMVEIGCFFWPVVNTTLEKYTFLIPPNSSMA